MKRRTLVGWAIAAVILSGALPLTLPLKGALASDSGDKASVPAHSPSWNLKMQKLYQTLASLLTDVTSDRRFADPANRSRIDAEARKLSGLVHDLTKKGMIPPDSDPTLSIVATLLGAETKRAVAALERGDRSYARGILRSVPSYCIACHTRNSTGPQLGGLPLSPTSESLTPVERGEFFAASRQFDRALTEFKAVVKTPKTAAVDSWVWTRDFEKAVRQGLAVSVRVKKDPDSAMEIVQTVLGSADAPSFMKEDAKTWKSSIEEWKQERPRQAETEQGLHAEAIRLMAKASQTQKYPMDRTADVIYLRASSAVHDLLQAAPEGAYAAEALLLAGISYEILSPLRMEDLQNVYYEGCIRRAPHTPIADVCFRRFEESAYLSYTGSAGQDVPEEVRRHILELKALSLASPEQPQPVIQK